jgi:predicted acylesterase/phospholipase RssA
MPRKILSLSGGGVRVYGMIGALREMEDQGINLHQFDLITCTSAGTVPGVLLTGGKTAAEIEQIVLKMPLAKFIDKGIIGEKLIFGGLDNKGLGDWIDSLKIPPSDKLAINTYDRKTNTQKIFTKADYETLGYGFAVRCSTRLPGIMVPLDDRYIDGGIIENPIMMFLDPDDQILCVNLGYAGEVPEETHGATKLENTLMKRFSDLSFAFDRKNYAQFKFMVDRFNNIDIISPKIYDIGSTDFWVTDAQKKDMVERGKLNTRPQIKAILSKWI